MNRTALGLLAGLLLALVTVLGGLLGFLLALVLGGVGYAVGAYADGDLDLGALTQGRRRG